MIPYGLPIQLAGAHVDPYAVQEPGAAVRVEGDKTVREVRDHFLALFQDPGSFP